VRRGSRAVTAAAAAQTKTYHMVDDEEEMLQKAEGTDIEWASGKNPTVKARPAPPTAALYWPYEPRHSASGRVRVMRSDAQRPPGARGRRSCGRRSAQVMKKKAKPVKGKPAGRMLTKTEPCASFFNFFAPPAVPDNPSEVDEEEMEELQHAMEEDYEIGRAPGAALALPRCALAVVRRRRSMRWRRTHEMGAPRAALFPPHCAPATLERRSACCLLWCCNGPACKRAGTAAPARMPPHACGTCSHKKNGIERWQLARCPCMSKPLKLRMHTAAPASCTAKRRAHVGARVARREIIRYKLIPRAVAYYTGEAAEDEEDDEDGDEYDDEDDDDEARTASGCTS